MCCYSLSSQTYCLAARSYKSYSIVELAAHVYRSRLQYAITNCSISRLTAIALRSISSDRASDQANNTILIYRSTPLKTVGFCDDETAKETSLLEDIAEAGSEEAVEDDGAWDLWG